MNKLQQYLSPDTRYHNTKSLSFLALLLFIVLTVLGYAAEESITLTTYYPSPYGVYGEMRLYPKSSPNSPCQEGTMYYDSDAGEKGLKVCDASGNPQPIGGGYWAAGSVLNSIYNTNPGNVGIGTASPNYKLDVTDSSYAAIRAFSTVAGQASQFILGNDAYASAALFLMGGTSYGSYGGSNALSIATTGNSDISLLTNAVERIRLKSTGNVRIGNAGIGGSPAAQLEVDSNSYPAMYARGNTGDLAIQLSNVGVNGRNFRLDSTANGSAYGVGKFVIADDSAGGSPARLAIDQFGNVGIGTPSPDTRLHIAGPATGAIKIEDGTQAAGRVLTSDVNGVGTWQPPGGGGMSNIRVFTISGTFTVPAGITKLWVEVYGGGGGGGGSSITYNSNVPGAGGGAGGVAMDYVAVTPGQNIAVTVGAGGSSPCGGVGNRGGFSKFLGLQSGGGSGGFTTSGYLAVQGGSGGSASGGSINLSGGIGTWGFAFPAGGGSYVGIMGYGGSNTRGIGGGNDGMGSTGGSIFGGGGAGSWAVAGSSNSCFSGGPGGSGGVIIWY